VCGICVQALASAVLLRSTIPEATQSLPVELDLVLLPDNHPHGVLIPSNQSRGVKRSSSRTNRITRASPSASPQNTGRMHTSHKHASPGNPRASSPAPPNPREGQTGPSNSPLRTGASRACHRNDSKTNVYVPSSPRGSSGGALPPKPPRSGQEPSPASSTAIGFQLTNPQSRDETCSDASWANDWSIREDPNSKAVKNFYIPTGGDTTSNIGQGNSNSAAGGSGASAFSALPDVPASDSSAAKSGLSKSTTKRSKPASSGPAIHRAGGASVSKMPAVPEPSEGEFSSATLGLPREGSDVTPPAAVVSSNAPSTPRSTAVAESASKKGNSMLSFEIASPTVAADRSRSSCTPASSAEPRSKTQEASSRSDSKVRGAAALAPSRAKSVQEADLLEVDEHLPPLPTHLAGNGVSANFTDSAALLSRSQQVPQGMSPSYAHPGGRVNGLPWNRTGTTTVSVPTLAPSVPLDELSRQALPPQGPSMNEAWKLASKAKP
jgi:hypothetical protein